jgi:hypothetical protein
MSIVVTQPSTLSLTPGEGVREFSNPVDPATFLGVSGLQFNVVLGATELLMGLPLAGANNTGAVYLSNIHGGLGSDARNPLAAPAAGFNPATPAFVNPEATGFFVPPSVNSANPKLNGYSNTEKVLRSSSDNPAQNGTIWIGTQGRRSLNFSLWISRSTALVPGLAYFLELYRDLNLADKSAGNFGVGTGATDLRNAQLIAQWSAPQALRNQNMPNLATVDPFLIPAGCNLYLLFRASDAAGGNLAVGSIWLS